MYLSIRTLGRIVCCVLVCAVVPAVAGDPAQRAADVRKVGIEPDFKSLDGFLQSLVLTTERQDKVRVLLLELGSDKFSVREKATAELLKLPPIPPQLLKQAAEKNAEARVRVERILARPQYAELHNKLLTVFRYVAAERVEGLAPIILQLMPSWDDASVLNAASDAVQLSATSADIKSLRKAIADSPSDAARVAAVASLATILEAKGADDLVTLLGDKSDRVKFEAAFALVNQGNRTALPTLVGLMESESAELRQAAAIVLKSATSHDVPFVSYDEPKKRETAVASWRAWLEKNAVTAKLQFPVSRRPTLRGRLLIGVWSDKRLIELDMATGKTVFEAGGFSYLWGCHATVDGHKLAVDFKGDFLVEFDSQGKERWRRTLPGHPTSVERLANGRTLVAMPESGCVIELDAKGEVAWKSPHFGRPTTAQRLVNGNTLICLQDTDRVIEIDSLGQIVWELLGLRTPHTAQALDNGNVLVCEFGNQAGAAGVREFDRARKLVWTCTAEVHNPAQAQRLPNGHTLISGSNGIVEIDAESKQVRHIPVSRSKFFAY